MEPTPNRMVRLESTLLSPDKRVVRAVTTALEKMLGWSGAQVLNFRVDVRMAATNPQKYEAELRALLGLPSTAVVTKIRDALCDESGQTPKSTCQGIEGCLSCIRLSDGARDRLGAPVQLTFHLGT